MTTPELLAKLTAFKTVSRDSNTALIQFVAGELTAAGGAVRVLPGDLPGKANFARIFGGPAQQRRNQKSRRTTEGNEPANVHCIFAHTHPSNRDQKSPSGHLPTLFLRINGIGFEGRRRFSRIG